MPIIYHVTTAAEWNAAQAIGAYESPSLKAEGFIHCSQDHQVAGVLERYFAGKTDLVKLVIDTDKLTSRFVFEWSPSTEDTFPHVYGTINVDAVVDIITIR
ncbi:MAG: DUF952 domain-containing protein [Lacibacter sp.]